MAYTTIDDPTKYFNTVLYTGNAADGSSTTQDISGVGFQPDWIWLKGRDNANNNVVDDSVRGANKHLFTNLTNSENTSTEYIKSFASDGFQLGGDGAVNGNGNTYVAWNWKAGGSASSNTDGDITSSVSANTTAGFSIVSWTGNGSAGQTIGHGLGAVPNIILTKGRSSALNWFFFDSMSSYLKRLKLNTTDAQADTDGLNDTAPTSSVFTVSGGGEANSNGVTYIGYLFSEKKGYSKFGSYTGNGNADGTFVYTGFKPAFIMVKGTNESNQDWAIFDNKRDPFNKVTQRIQPSSSAAESGGQDIDFLSNGIKFRVSGDFINGSYNYIYMAFAEAPFVTAGTKAAGTAR